MSKTRNRKRLKPAELAKRLYAYRRAEPERREAERLAAMKGKRARRQQRKAGTVKSTIRVVPSRDGDSAAVAVALASRMSRVIPWLRLRR